MSAETRDLIRIVEVTDHDCGNYQIGEVDFRYSPEDIERHIRKYGADGLLRTLNHFIHLAYLAIDQMALEQQRGEQS